MFRLFYIIWSKRPEFFDLHWDKDFLETWWNMTQSSANMMTLPRSVSLDQTEVQHYLSEDDFHVRSELPFKTQKLLLLSLPIKEFKLLFVYTYSLISCFFLWSFYQQTYKQVKQHWLYDAHKWVDIYWSLLCGDELWFVKEWLRLWKRHEMMFSDLLLVSVCRQTDL